MCHYYGDILTLAVVDEAGKNWSKKVAPG